jgi:hypothetical protein
MMPVKNMMGRYTIKIQNVITRIGNATSFVPSAEARAADLPMPR